MLKRFTLRSFALGLATVAAAAVASPAAGQNLPAAQDLIDRYVETIGGRDALLASEYSRLEGSMSIPAMGMSGELEVYSGPDNQMLTIVTLPGLGETRSGISGDIGWAVDPNMGPRVLEGAELEAMLEQADPRAGSLRDAEYFESRETMELTEMNGEACYKVKLVWKSERESFDCYSQESGLLIATIATQESPMGAIEVVTLISDYQTFGDIMAPTSMRMQMMGMEQIMEVGTVEYGGFDDSIFELPEEIRALLPAG